MARTTSTKKAAAGKRGGRHAAGRRGGMQRGSFTRGPNLYIVEMKNGNNWQDLGQFKSTDNVLSLIKTKMASGDIDSLNDVRVLSGSILGVGPALVNYTAPTKRATTTARGRTRRAAATTGSQVQAQA
jgi:hypothetical protein